MKSSKVDAAINDYIDHVVRREKEKYHNKLQPFSLKEEQIREELNHSLHDFQDCYSKGYHALLEVVKANKSLKSSDFVVDAKKLTLFDDTEKLIEILQQGQPIYEVLGLKPEAIGHFYEAACQLSEKKELEKAKDAFYFLVTIASHIYPFWLALGQAYCDLRQYKEALNTFIHAIDIDPAESEGYLGALHVLVEAKDFEQAEKVCEQGIQFAKVHKLEALTHTLEESRRVISTLFIDSQDLNYPS